MNGVTDVLKEIAVGGVVLGASAGLFRIASVMHPLWTVALLVGMAWVLGALILPLFVDDES